MKLNEVLALKDAPDKPSTGVSLSTRREAGLPNTTRQPQTMPYGCLAEKKRDFLTSLSNYEQYENQNGGQDSFCFCTVSTSLRHIWKFRCLGKTRVSRYRRSQPGELLDRPLKMKKQRTGDKRDYDTV